MRAIEIFRLLHQAKQAMPVGEIARRLEAPRSTVYEIVNLLLAAGLLESAGPGSAVHFGRAIYLYGNDYFATHKILRLAQEEVRRLSGLSGETAQFSMPVGNKYAVVAMQNSARLFRISSELGVLVPMPWTASGRLFVAHMTLPEIVAFIPPEDFVLQDGRRLEPSQFFAEAQASSAAGICVLSGHVDEYATCLAVPVGLPGAPCFGCICLAVSRGLSQRKLSDLSRLLIETGKNLSAAMTGDLPHIAQ